MEVVLVGQMLKLEREEEEEESMESLVFVWGLEGSGEWKSLVLRWKANLGEEDIDKEKKWIF